MRLLDTTRWEFGCNPKDSAESDYRPTYRQQPEVRLVNSVLQSLASFETWDLGCFDADRLAGLRVAASTRSALFNGESTETYQYDGVTRLQCTSNRLDHCIQRTAGNSFRDVSGCGNSIDQFRLVHSKSPYFR